MVGMMPSRSRRAHQMPASAMDPKSFLPVFPPALLASSVSAAAVPIGYSRSDSSTNRRRMSAVHTRPSSVPAKATTNSEGNPISLALPSIQMPGMVKARPPATMEPADMMTCVIFASFKLVLPSARSSTSAVMDVKMVGQGRAPILRAVYTDDAVMMTQPTQPMTIPAALSCSRDCPRVLDELICVLLRISAPPVEESGYGVKDRYSIVSNNRSDGHIL